MNLDAILETLNSANVDYILIGGMNFLLRHKPELTYDVDLWVEDTERNLSRLNGALKHLGAEWGPTEKSWAPVPDDYRWLQKQALFCLTSKQGAIDIFRDVKGLENQYDRCRQSAYRGATFAGVSYAGLSDADMLACQEALSPREQKLSRMQILREALAGAGPKP